MGMQTSRNKKAFAEINVTPLVDVMLVLLIVFMMTAPLMVSGVNLNLPKTKKVSSLSSSGEQFILSITKNGDLYLKSNQLSNETWSRDLKTLLKDSGNEIVFIRADELVSYGRVARVISLLKAEGIHKVSLITENTKEL